MVDRAEDLALIESLQIAGYAARVERAIVIGIEAYDWNCPQHITPRFTEAEIREMTSPWVAELAALRSAAAGECAEQDSDIGDGSRR